MIQSAKNTEGSDKGLSVDEFTNLMFSCDDKLNVNLDKLHPMAEYAPSKPPTGHSTVMSGQQIENQWKFYLQRSVKNVVNDLLRDDEEKTWLVDQEPLMKVLDRRA